MFRIIHHKQFSQNTKKAPISCLFTLTGALLKATQNFISKIKKPYPNLQIIINEV
jgi:hypothetical protein